MAVWPYRGKTFTEPYRVTVDAGGGLEYSEGFAEVVVCQRVEEEWLGALDAADLEDRPVGPPLGPAVRALAGRRRAGELLHRPPCDELSVLPDVGRRSVGSTVGERRIARRRASGVRPAVVPRGWRSAAGAVEPQELRPPLPFGKYRHLPVGRRGDGRTGSILDAQRLDRIRRAGGGLAPGLPVGSDRAAAGTLRGNVDRDSRRPLCRERRVGRCGPGAPSGTLGGADRLPAGCAPTRGGSQPTLAASNAAAMANVIRSLPRGVTICRPTGRPEGPIPQGREMAGQPVTVIV